MFGLYAGYLWVMLGLGFSCSFCHGWSLTSLAKPAVVAAVGVAGDYTSNTNVYSNFGNNINYKNTSNNNNKYNNNNIHNNTYNNNNKLCPYSHGMVVVVEYLSSS